MCLVEGLLPRQVVGILPVVVHRTAVAGTVDGSGSHILRCERVRRTVQVVIPALHAQRQSVHYFEQEGQVGVQVIIIGVAVVHHHLGIGVRGVGHVVRVAVVNACLGIHQFHGGRERDDVAPVGRAVVLVDAAAVHLGADGEPGLYISVHVDTQTVRLPLRADSDGLLVEHVARDEVFHFLRTTCHAQAIVLCQGGLRHEVHPVDAFRACAVGLQVGVGDDGGAAQLVQCRAIFVGIHQLILLAQGGNAEVGVQRYAGTSLRTALGGDEDDTIGSARTINGGRRSILQHFHRLDIVGIQSTQAAGRYHAVNDVQRVAALVDGSGAAYTHLHPRAGQSARCRYLHTCGTSLQDVLHTAHGLILELAGIDTGDGSRKVALLHRSVTDDHYFLQQLVVLFQHHGIVAHTAVYADGLRVIADERHLDVRPGRHLQRKLAVYVTRRPDLRLSLHDDGGANDTLALFVGHDATDAQVTVGQHLIGIIGLRGSGLCLHGVVRHGTRLLGGEAAGQ